MKNGGRVPNQRIWLTLEAQEIVELKQLMMDRDVAEAREFFHRVVVPHVRQAAQRRGIAVEESRYDHLPR